eukprot:12038-Heterococcus_DN1.PRE.1
MRSSAFPAYAMDRSIVIKSRAPDGHYGKAARTLYLLYCILLSCKLKHVLLVSSDDLAGTETTSTTTKWGVQGAQTTDRSQRRQSCSNVHNLVCSPLCDSSNLRAAVAGNSSLCLGALRSWLELLLPTSGDLATCSLLRYLAKAS